jgi:hypothetical protein
LKYSYAEEPLKSAALCVSGLPQEFFSFRGDHSLPYAAARMFRRSSTAGRLAPDRRDADDAVFVGKSVD